MELGGDVELQKRAAGCVGKRVRIEGRAELRGTYGFSPEKFNLVVIVTKM